MKSAVIKKLPTHKSPGLDSYTGDFYKTFKEELTHILHTLFQIVQEGRRLPNPFYEASVILIPKQDKYITKKENFRSISLMNKDAKILIKILANTSSTMLKRPYTMIKWDSSQGCKDGTILSNQ